MMRCQIHSPKTRLKKILCILCLFQIIRGNMILQSIKNKMLVSLTTSIANLFATDFSCPVGWGCRIHQLLLCRGVRPPPTNEYPGYDTKSCDGEVPVLLGLLGMWSTPSLPLLPSPLWPRMVAPDRALTMG